MNLVERIARMIDAEGAYGVWYDTTANDTEPCAPTTRQKYFRAKYEGQAVKILKLLSNETPGKIKAALIEFEKDGWRRLGAPIDDPALKPMADDIIAAKYT